MTVDPAAAADGAGELIEKINELMGPGWKKRLARPDRAHIAVYRETNAVALYCPTTASSTCVLATSS
jgi:hypothetical protein